MITNADSYKTGIAPEIGGEIDLAVDDWGTWNTWLVVEDYNEIHDPATIVLLPRESLSLAWRLVVAAIVCQFKRIQAKLRRTS